MNEKRFLTSWSGGKDSCYACILSVRAGMEPVALLNVLNENGKISRSHAIPKEILEQQARLAGIPMVTTPSSWQEYESHFVQSLLAIKSEYNAAYAVFGDIDLQEHRDWEEKVCKVAGLEAILPLWKQDRKSLVLQMIDIGIEAHIVSCNGVMGEKFLGRRVTRELIPELERLGVDPCGENGEYHTIVTGCPIFSQRMEISFGKKMNHEGYWFIEMV